MDMPADLTDDIAWDAFMARDRRYDGRFVVGVSTTGIYCRPSCPAKRPARKNAVILADGNAASAAGYRPCKRCHPDDVTREEEAVARALAILREVEEKVPLAGLASETGYSASHLQRIFKRAVGLSPAAYARALRLERAGEAMSGGSSVTEAVYEAGFSAASRFYEASNGRLGMTASAWRNGGLGVVIRWSVVETSLGAMLVAATDKGVCRLSFNEGPEELARRFPNAKLCEGGGEFAALLTDIVGAVEQPGDSRAIPLDVQGTAFQEAVWAELRKIPHGETRSYGEIAAAIGRPGAVRAAGSANGANPVAVLVPCHRVVRADGSMGGYAYGEDIKRELLRREEQSQR